MKNLPPVVLASQSPRRKQLLQWADISFTVVVRPTSEEFPDHFLPEDAAMWVAEKKALAVANQDYLNTPVIAADTMVVVDNHILGKPKDRSDAMAMLQLLSGRAHQVTTGVVVLYRQQVYKFADTTTVYFNELNLAEMEYYVDKYQPYDKAGAYGIQEWLGVTTIAKIEGDFYNVMGLPVNRVVKLLHQIVG